MVMLSYINIFSLIVREVMISGLLYIECKKWLIVQSQQVMQEKCATCSCCALLAVVLKYLVNFLQLDIDW